MSDQSLFKAVKLTLPECNKLPEIIKEILNTTNNSLKDLNENDSKCLWTALHEFVKETSVLENISEDKELLTCYQCILNLTHHAIIIAEDIMCVYNNEYLLKTMMMFQSFYSKNFKFKFKLEIVKMYSSFWKAAAIAWSQSEALNRISDSSLEFDTVVPQAFTLTFNFIFDTVKVTTKKSDMKILSSILWEFWKVLNTLSNCQNVLNLIVLNLEKTMKNASFLETETGKLIIADIFTTNQQLFMRFHSIVKQNLPKAKKFEAEAYGEIYFMAWINSNASIKETVEQQGMFDLISKTLILKRTGKPFRTYRNALILLQSMQNHRKHLMFSKVITKLYAPILWRQLRSEFKMVRCNATEILARAYPLEKRGEGRELSSRFLIKQQNAFLDLLEDTCPQVRICAIKGICSCMRYFWGSFEEECIAKFFTVFVRLIDESVFEVRQVMFYGFCQLLEEKNSHDFFRSPSFRVKLKKTLYDENEKVRRAFINFLLKIKKIDNKSETTDKINFAQIVNLRDTASALACEDKQNGLLFADLIFDNFVGDKVPDKNTTLMRLNMFYNINPNACRKLMFYSEKHLDFNAACRLILSLLKTVYVAIKKKEEHLKNTDKENSIPAKKRKPLDDSDNTSNTSHSSCSTSANLNEESDQNEQTKVCCILDIVSCLMILHRNTFIDESNRPKLKEIQDSCASCLIKLFKFYKEGDAYFSAMNLSSLIPVSKLTAHVSVPSTAISTLQKLPFDIKRAEEEIDMRRVNCLVYTLCMWKRGYEILQFVNIWFDEAFKTLNLNETQYPESKAKEGKRVRFQTNIDECKPMTGILLINSILINSQTQKTLFDSEVNKKNIYDLFSYLNRIKAAIDNRISSDNALNNLLTDEVLIELFQLHIRLHIIYHSHDKSNLNVDEIIKYQTSLLDWVTNNLLIHDLHEKNENTVAFATKIVEVVNYMVLNMCLMEFVNNTFLDNFLTFCATVLHHYLGPRVLISMIKTLMCVSKHLNYMNITNNNIYDPSSLANCVCSIISVLGESKFTEERFTSVIGGSVNFRRELTLLILELCKLSTIEFKRVLATLIETIMQIITNQIREIDEVDLNEQLTEMPFAAYQLSTVILNNVQLRKHFSSNAIEIFSSHIFKNDCAMLLSAISFVYTLSFQQNQLKTIDLEPVVKLMYKTLMDHDKTTTPLGDNCTINKTKVDQGVSVLETSDFSDEIMDFKQKGRDVLIATAKQLHITLSE